MRYNALNICSSNKVVQTTYVLSKVIRKFPYKKFQL